MLLVYGTVISVWLNFIMYLFKTGDLVYLVEQILHFPLTLICLLNNMLLNRYDDFSSIKHFTRRKELETARKCH